MLFRDHLEIRLDENLDGLFAGVDLDADSFVVKVDLLASSVRSSNDGVGHHRLVLRDRGHVRPPLSVPHPRRTVYAILVWSRTSRWIKVANHSEPLSIS